MTLGRREFLALMGAGAGSSLLLAACGKLGGDRSAKGPVIGILQMVDAPPPTRPATG